MQDAAQSGLIGGSTAISSLRGYLDKVALTDASVLITGETGTGKECVARYLHEHGARARAPMVSINCSALPEGLLESELFGHERGAFTGAHQERTGKLRQATGGTLFLDEIGDMPLAAQAKILRALEDRTVTPVGGRHAWAFDVRVIAATNLDPAELVDGRRLRRDLYYPLNVVQLHLPPLRDRKEDLVQLYMHFMRQKLPAGVAPPALGAVAIELMMRYDWPGNVREVRNFVERVLVDPPEGEVTAAHLPAAMQAMPEATIPERERILTALLAARWNKSKAADSLNWSRMTLYRKLARYQLSQHPPPGD